MKTQTKICLRCNQDKSQSDFGRDLSRKDNLSVYCKKCNTERTRIYKEKNPEKIIDTKKREYINNKSKYIETRKKYWDENKDVFNEKNRIKRKENKDECLKKDKIYYEKNKVQILENILKYRQKNIEKYNGYQKDYRNQNTEKINAYKREYNKKRYNNDSTYKIRRCVRHRLNSFLKSKKMIKNNTTFKIIGCNPDELKIYLEKQFTEGMTWENYGYYGWHIDHKIPLESGKNEEEIYELCHYTNLQPLWWKENLSKGMKIL